MQMLAPFTAGVGLYVSRVRLLKANLAPVAGRRFASALQETSKPAFLIDEALVEPTFAIELSDREKPRLRARLPAMRDEVRADAGTANASVKTIRTSAATIT